MKPWVVIVDYCWGARHISYWRPILSLNPRNRVPGSGWWTVSFGGLSVFVIPYFLLVCWLVCSFLDRIVLSTLLVLTGMSHLVEIPCWSSDSLGGSWWDEWPFILDWLNMPRPLICAVLLSLILAPLHRTNQFWAPRENRMSKSFSVLEIIIHKVQILARIAKSGV